MTKEVQVYDWPSGKGMCEMCGEDVGPCEGYPCVNAPYWACPGCGKRLYERGDDERQVCNDYPACGDLIALRAENERLRTALEAFIAGIDDAAWYPPDHWMTPLRDAAVAALGNDKRA